MRTRSNASLFTALLRRQGPQATARRRPRSQPSLGLVLCGLLAGCASSPSRPPGVYPTIVSLNPCTDAILAEVADRSQLLAISHYSQDARSSSMDLASARRLRGTGGTVEEVAALAPDIVVGSSFMAPATRAALGDLGFRVESFASPATVEESIAQVRALARLAGHPERGERLVRRIEQSAAPRPVRPVAAALWQAGGIVPGRGTLVSDLLRRAGLASYAELRGMAQGDYLPLERIAADPPGLLLVAGEERGQRHPVLARIPGLRVARFAPRLFYCGGPSIPRAMAVLRRLRSPPRNGKGDHAKHGGGAPAAGVTFAGRAPPPPYGWSPSPAGGGA